MKPTAPTSKTVPQSQSQLQSQSQPQPQPQPQYAGEETVVTEPWIRTLLDYRSSSFQVFANVQRETVYSKPWESYPPERVSGSMFLVTRDKALTNFHVLQNVNEKGGMVDGQVAREVHGQTQAIGFKIISVAPAVDLALVQLNPKILKDQQDKTIPFRFTSDLRVTRGARTAALDFPLGLLGGPKVTIGNLSGYRDGFLQTTTLVHQGSSGSALFVEVKTSTGIEARVVGIISNGLLQQPGMNYAIPSSVVLAILPSMLLQNSVPYPVLEPATFAVDMIPADEDAIISNNVKNFTQKTTGQFRGAMQITRRRHLDRLYSQHDLRPGDLLLSVQMPDVITGVPGQINNSDIVELEKEVQIYAKQCLDQGALEKTIAIKDDNLSSSFSSSSSSSFSSSSSSSSFFSSPSSSSLSSSTSLFDTAGSQPLRETKEEKEMKGETDITKLFAPPPPENKTSSSTLPLPSSSTATTVTTVTTVTTKSSPSLCDPSSLLISESGNSSNPDSLCFPIPPTSFYTRGTSFQASDSQTFYYPFRVKSSYPRIRLTFMNLLDKTVSIESKETANSPWMTSEISKMAARNFSFHD